jgi:hypothetical protein
MTAARLQFAPALAGRHRPESVRATPEDPA